MVSAAKLAYRPVGIVASIAAGAIASAVFKQIWKRVADEDDAPGAMQSEYSLGQVLLAATMQGAIFAAGQGADRPRRRQGLPAADRQLARRLAISATGSGYVRVQIRGGLRR